LTGSRWLDILVGLLLSGIPILIVNVIVLVDLLAGNLSKISETLLNLPSLLSAIVVCLFFIIAFRLFSTLLVTGLITACLVEAWVWWFG